MCIKKASKIIGLTGGIASGKTEIGEIFRSLGARLIDADVVARKVVEEGSEGFKRLSAAFAEQTSGGKIDRRALRELVFADREKRKILDGIMFPLIKKAICDELDKSEGIVVIVAPLLFESGLFKLCDVVVAVSADRGKRLARLIRRDGINAELAAAMIEAQMTDSERNERADYVIANDESKEALYKNAVSLYNEIIGDC